MNKSYLFILLLVFSCGSSKLIVTDPANVSPKQSEVLKKDEQIAEELYHNKNKNLVVSFSNTKSVSEMMSFLASDDLKGRDTGSEGIEKAANFIEKVFQENNISSYFKSYKDTLLNYNKPAFNVVGYLEGNDAVLKKQFVIIGAHYDHLGMISPIAGDAIANGANDNASGTTTVLELARYFGNKKNNKRSIIFVLFSAEEKGLLGSKHLAKKLKDEELGLYTMLNFEMVGVPLVDKDYAMYVTGYENSNLAEICNKYAQEKFIGFLPAAKGYNLFKRSDNYPFHEEFNVPSQTFCTFDFTNFDHYHGVDDEVGIMDYNHMVSIVNKTISVLENIVNAPIKEITY